MSTFQDLTPCLGVFICSILSAAFTFKPCYVPDGDRPQVPNVLIMLTDGVPNVDVDRTIPEAINMHIDGMF